MGGSAVRRTFRLYLRYVAHLPVVQVVSFVRPAYEGRALSYRTLTELLRRGPALNFLLLTPRGVCSVAQCLATRSGGQVLLGWQGR